MKIVICGSENDKSINNILLSAIDKYKNISFCDLETLNNSEDSDDLFYIYNCSEVPEKLNGKGILIFKNSFSLVTQNKAYGNFIPILDSQNIKAAEFLKGTDKIAITCGMSFRDTFCLCSLGFSNAVVSLQRNIFTIDSKLIEPHDFKVDLKEKIGVYPILATCAVLILTGISSTSGYSI